MRLPILYLILLFCITATAQKKAKIKGDKNVTSEERTFDYFSKIEVNDKIKLSLKQDSSTRLSIEADENLHDVIESELHDGTLTLSLNKRITSSKRLEMILYVDDLNRLELNDDSEVDGIDTFSLFDIEFVLNDKSEIIMDVEAQIFTAISDEKSDGTFTVKADSISITLKESSKSEYVIDAEKLHVFYSGSAMGEFVGKTKQLVLDANDNATFKGYELVAQYASIEASNNTSSYVNCNSNLEISAKNKAKVYIFNTPVIEIKTFEDAASIFKRESMSLMEKL